MKALTDRSRPQNRDGAAKQHGNNGSKTKTGRQPTKNARTKRRRTKNPPQKNDSGDATNDENTCTVSSKEHAREDGDASRHAQASPKPSEEKRTTRSRVPTRTGKKGAASVDRPSQEAYTRRHVKHTHCCTCLQHRARWRRFATQEDTRPQQAHAAATEKQHPLYSDAYACRRADNERSTNDSRQKNVPRRTRLTFS